ncbi:MAG: DNA recombination protein RmuC [Candidatus Vogelbacteria bacterium]|nr:DNA recombination protein RmuC [Candidatus Vogelbacteria bacterium]
MTFQQIFILIITFVAGGGILAFIILKLRTGPKPADDGRSLLLLQNQIENLTKTLDSRMGETNKLSNESSRQQFSEFTRLSQEVTAKLVKLEETNKQVMNFTEQLQSLQDVLKNPKQRGILGEYYLETLLKNVLPPGSYEMQYLFKDGTIVDAVVHVKDKIIPIDSKFSLENYNRIVEERDPAQKEVLEKAFRADLKLRIDETGKYVKPEEGTMDFAFMFIPHEAIYYDLLVSQVVGAVKLNTRDLIDYAFREKHVIIVSPTSFLAYLQTVLQGLRALKIEESAMEIRTRVEELGKHITAYDEYYKKLGNSLSTTISHYNTGYKELKKIDKDVVRIAGGVGTSSMMEPLSLEKPNLED